MSNASRSCMKNALHLEPLETRQLLAATPTLVADINATTAFLGASNVVQVGNVGFFSGNANGAEGPELFKTDGTAAGTVLVKDINTTTRVGSAPANLTNVNGTLYFTADDGVGGREVYRSDGTTANTIRVADLNVGSGSASPGNLTNVGGTLYFTATDGSGVTLWKSDGTAAGTTKVTLVGSSATLANPNFLVAFNGALLLSAGPSTSNLSLYRVIGNSAMLVTSTPASPSRLTVFNNAVYFTSGSTSSLDSGDLFKTDGTAANTTRVRSIDYSSGFSDYARAVQLTVSGDRLYFLSGSISTGTLDLWVSDGTTAGTNFVTSDSAFATNTVLTPAGIRSVLFSKTAAATGREPWVTDGTITQILKDTVAGTGSISYGLAAATLANGRSLFTTSGGYGMPAQVYTTAGTPATTTLVTSIDSPGYAYALGSVNGAALLTNLRQFGSGDLYRSDGTAAGTSRISANVAATETSLSNNTDSDVASIFYPVGDTVYFSADDGLSGRELYKVIGNGAPLRVADISAGGSDSAPTSLITASDGSLYFAASQPLTASVGLFRIAPTANTPQLVASVPVINDSGSISQLVAVGRYVYFRVYNPTLSRGQLWKCDSSSGTSALVTLANGDTLMPSRVVQAGTKWYFGALEYGANGSLASVQERLFSVDTTGALPQLVADIPGAGAYIPTPIGAIGSTVFLEAYTPATGYELYKSDGTAAGTTLAAELNPGSAGTAFDYGLARQTLSYNGVLYFTAEVNNVPRAWRTDGTAAGTYAIGDALVSDPSFAVSAGNIYFVGIDGLYRADGATATRMVSFGTGDAAFAPQSLISAGGNLYSVGLAGTGTQRWELWKGNASLSTFDRVAVLGPKTDPVTSNFLSSFYLYGRQALAATTSNLYFPMYTDANGIEPYRLALYAPPTRQSVMVGGGVAQGFTVTVHYDVALNSSVRLTGAVLKNLTTNTTYAASQVSAVVSDSDLILRFSVTSSGVLPDGNYTLMLPSGAVTSTGGAAAADTFAFQVLAGDANADGKVDVIDLGILSGNWQKNGATFAQGDFNYDGKVDVIDLGLLSSNWQKSLPAAIVPNVKPGKIAPPAKSKATTKTSIARPAATAMSSADRASLPRSAGRQQV